MKSNYQPKETIHKQTHRNVISSFTGKYTFLSNFYPAPVTYMGQTYANNEAAFQAQKTSCAKEQQQFSIFRLHNPAEAKKRGKKLTLRPDWDKVKISLMYEICMCKFDYFWGKVNGNGENQLGLILMDVREKLKWSLEMENEIA